MNVRTGKQTVRGFGELNTVRDLVVSEDSGNSSQDTHNSDWRKSYQSLRNQQK